MKKSLFACVLILLFLAYNARSQEIQLGVNLTDQGAFVNIVNHSARYTATSFDEHGWPMSDFEMVLMDGRPVLEWGGVVYDPEEYRVDYSGTYKACFNGQADLSVWGSGASIQNKTFDDEENKTYFDLVIPGPPQAEHGIVFLTVSNTMRTQESPINTGITNLVVNRPGYPLETEKIFTDEYLELCRAANFECYRYYGIQNIWGIEPVFPATLDWNNRKVPEDASQTQMPSIGKLDPWCWEYIIELANILDRDIWICIPISADRNYVVSLAQMLNDELNPGINIYIENSNEVWSPTHESHGAYNQAQAEHYGISFDQNYGRRSVDLTNWFAEVFGEDQINKRIRNILAGQQVYLGRHDIHLEYIDDNFGPPKDYIYALSTAIYFGTSNPAGDPDEINDGMIEEINSQIEDDENALNRSAHIKKNNDWDLPGACTSYEGGPHFPAGGGTENLGNAIESHRTVKMGDIMKLNFKEGWADLGGGLACVFNMAGGYNRYGCWGLTDDYTKPFRNHKMQAIKDLIGGWTSVVDIETEGLILKAYPNPVEENLKIRLNENKYDEANVRIIDPKGNMVFSGKISVNNGEIEINRGNYIFSGIYIIEVEIGTGKSTVKVIYLN